jgi:UDP-glucose 4-epimerase
MRRILITGGSGFIGSNLVEYFNLKSPETEVVVYDDFSGGSRENISGMDCAVHEYSVLDSDNLKKSIKGVDSVIHLAAIGSVPRSIANPLASHHANASGTLNVLEAARESGVEHVVVASSSSVYGGNPAMPKHELDWVRPQSPYAVSKLATEAYALAYQASYGLKTLAFRFFNVYGPRQRANHDYAAVIPQFINAAIKQRPLPIFGDGYQSRDFTFVESVCSALYLTSLNKITHTEPVNLAFGTNTTLLELVDKLSMQFGRPLKIAFGDQRPGDVRASQADCNSMRALLPSVEATDLDDGLARTIDWFRTQPSDSPF